MELPATRTAVLRGRVCESRVCTCGASFIPCKSRHRKCSAPFAACATQLGFVQRWPHSVQHRRGGCASHRGACPANCGRWASRAGACALRVFRARRFVVRAHFGFAHVHRIVLSVSFALACARCALARVNRALERAGRGLTRALLSVGEPFPGIAFRLGFNCPPGHPTRAVPPATSTKNSNSTHSMNDRETRRYDMFGRVKTFGTDNATDFAAGGEA